MSPQQLFDHSMKNLGNESTFKPPDPLYGKYIPRSKSMMKFSPEKLQQLVEEFTVKEYLTNISSESDDDIIVPQIDRGSNHGPSTCSKLPFLLENSSLVVDVRKSVKFLFLSDRLQTDLCTLDETEAIVLEVIRNRHWNGFTRHNLFKKLCRFLYLQQKGVNDNCFERVRVLGRGGFGMVYVNFFLL